MAHNYDSDGDWSMPGPSRTRPSTRPQQRDTWGMDVDPPPAPAHTNMRDVLPQELAEETPFQQLIRHWMNERHAPDVLHAQEVLLGRLLDHIKKQVRCSCLSLPSAAPSSAPSPASIRACDHPRAPLTTPSCRRTTCSCCAPTRTAARTSTSGSCSSRPKSSASSSSSAPTSARVSTRCVRVLTAIVCWMTYGECRLRSTRGTSSRRRRCTNV